MCWKRLGQTAFALAVSFTFTAGTPSWAATPSEILQKAIYTEETVGNVDEAIKLYEQVIAEGKSARNAAAQAQYRLAQCMLKKNQQAEAKVAFEKLIKDFPEEKELVAKARQQLPSEIKLLPAPWQDHEALQLDMKLAGGLDIGVYIYSVDSAKRDGKDVWHCTTRGYVAINSAQSYSTVFAEKESFAPISSRWMHSLIGDVEATYKPQAVELKDLLKNTTRDLALDGPVFDNEQGAELFRRLPLAVGYKASLPLVTSLGGAKIAIELEVTGKEAVEVPAGKFDCFKLVLNVGQTFWISTDAHRYVVKFEAGGAVAELAKIHQLEPGKTTVFDTTGYSLTLPDRWFAYSPKPADGADDQQAFIVDDDGIVTIAVGAKTPKADEPKKSVQERATADFAQLKKVLKDFKVRDPGAKELTISGRPAYTAVADYTEGGKKMVIIGTSVFGDKAEVEAHASVTPENFEAEYKNFEQVLQSLKLK